MQADFACKWNDSLQKPVCQQIGHTIPEARVLLMREMHDAGLPVRADKDVLFSVLESASTGWSLMEANYEHVAGDKVTICQVIAVAKQGTEVQTIRKVAFQTTDADVPKVATWSLVDIADVSGKLGFILEGDAYEDHWLEVDEMRDGPFKTIFSGLGYYL